MPMLEAGAPSLAMSAGQDGSGTGGAVLRMPTEVRSRSVMVGAALILCSRLALPAGQAPAFLRGDADNDGGVSLVDPVHLKRWLTQSGAAPPCLAAADVDGNASLNITDVISLLRFLFLGDTAIAPPFPECGVDPGGGSSLSCEAAPVCSGPIPSVRDRFRLFVSTRPDAAEPESGVHHCYGVPGAEIEVPFFVILSGRGEEPFALAEAWSFGLALEVESEPATLEEVTTAGTLAADQGQGGVRRNGFETTLPVLSGGAVSSVLLGLLNPITLPETAPVLRGRVRTRVPSGGEAGALTLRPVQGLRGPGEPVAVEVVAGARSHAPEAFPLRIEVGHVDPFGWFLRGDANQDGMHNLSDPIYTLDWRFRGGSSPHCIDAADANDDGAVDISDPILSLGCLFLGTRCPSPPYPGCGSDPTGDRNECFELGLECR